MMDRFLRLASIVVVAAGVAACEDDTEAPVGETSTVNVSVFVEDGAQDDPIAGATVTLDPVEGDANLTATTGADGVATFNDVPAGVYTATHTPATAITNATLTGSTEQTVVAQFEGGTTEAAFVYSYKPGTVAVQFFRDEDDDDAYDPAVDTTLGGFQAVLIQGTDTVVTPPETSVTLTADSTGLLTFESLAQGDYTLLIRPIIGSEVTDTVIAVTVAAGATTDLLVEFTGGEAVADIGDARALPLGSSVTVEGVITAGTGVYGSTTAYLQDATGALVIDQFGRTDVVTLSLGDTVRVTGTTDVFNDELRVEGGNSLEITVMGNGPVPAPRVVTAAEVNAGQFEGELVQVVAATVDSIDGGFSSTVWVSEGAEDLAIYISGTTGIDMAGIIVGETYTFTGVNSRYQDLFEIKPRSDSDVILTSTPAGTQPIAVARLLPDGEVVTIQGVVTAAQNTYRDDNFYIQDATGGIQIFGIDASEGIALGDSLEITGELDTFSERELVDVTITNLGTGTVPDPVEVDGENITAGQYQGMLAVIDSVEVLEVSVSGSGNVTVLVTDGAEEFTVYGDVDTGLTGGDFVVGNSYAITGIMASVQFDDDPTMYQIKPRSTADVVGL